MLPSSAEIRSKVLSGPSAAFRRRCLESFRARWLAQLCEMFRRPAAAAESAAPEESSRARWYSFGSWPERRVSDSTGIKSGFSRNAFSFARAPLEHSPGQTWQSFPELGWHHGCGTSHDFLARPSRSSNKIWKSSFTSVSGMDRDLNGKNGFSFAFQQKNEGRRHQVRAATSLLRPYLRLISLRILRIIFVTQKALS